MHEITESIRKSIRSNTTHTHTHIYILTSVWNPFWDYPPSAPYVGSDSSIPSEAFTHSMGDPLEDTLTLITDLLKHTLVPK